MKKKKLHRDSAEFKKLEAIELEKMKLWLSENLIADDCESQLI